MDSWQEWLLFIAILLAVGSCQVKDAFDCKRMGGVYLWREWTCLDAREIRQ